MEIVYYIIGIPFAIFMLFGFSMIVGGVFRRWNEGKKFDEENTKRGLIKTFTIGFVLLLAIVFIISKCEG